jgi:O-Antigen ligase
MGLIILIPAVACWMVLARGSARSALINVYLPTVLLLPQYFELRFPHLPPLTFAGVAILPLGVALLVNEGRRWRLDWMDVLVVLFAASAAISEGMSQSLAEGTWTQIFTSPAVALPSSLNNGIFQLFEGMTTMVLPYMAGKLLIEQGGYQGQPTRKPFLRRMVILLAIVAAVSVTDFLTGKSTWQTLFNHFFPTQPQEWPMQVRWGFGRIAGPFAHAILAGMMFLMGLIYCIWLRLFAPEWGTRKVFKEFSLTLRGLVLWAIVAGLLMTQSRGPWIGAVLALIFVFLMGTFPMGKAAAIFFVLMAALSVAGYYYGNKYTESKQDQVTSEGQQNAIYRRNLIRNFIPVVMQRKAFGWGITTHPTANGQDSVDNEYLLLSVTQGFTGLGLFLAIAAACGGRLLWLAARPNSAEDKGLVIAHLAVLIGLMTTIATVYLGEQVFLLFFLIVGWVQGMNPAREAVGARSATAPRFEFRRVLT